MMDLDRMLRDAAGERIADEGFGKRVMGALPPPARRRRPWTTPVFVFGSTALGGALAVVLAPAHLSLIEGFADLARMRILTPAAVTAMGMALALTATAAVLALEDD